MQLIFPFPRPDPLALLTPLVNIFSIIQLVSFYQSLSGSASSPGYSFFFLGSFGPFALYLSARSTASLFVCTSQTLLSAISKKSNSSDLKVLVTVGIGVTLYFRVSSRLKIGL